MKQFYSRFPFEEMENLVCEIEDLLQSRQVDFSSDQEIMDKLGLRLGLGLKSGE